jgi:hypothetical protein
MLHSSATFISHAITKKALKWKEAVKNVAKVIEYPSYAKPTWDSNTSLSYPRNKSKYGI